MRPDKKGNKKRDERRNGPKVASQKTSASSQKPQDPAQKIRGPVQKACGAVHEASGAAAARAEQSALIGQGPRVLEPAAPSPTEAPRCQRREIRSHWHRDDQEPSPPPTDEDFLRGDTFAELLAASGESG